MRAFTLSFLLVSGCMFQHISTENKLQEAVHSYNDAVRWNRLDLAQQQVEPANVIAFKVQHAKMGRSVQVANVEVLSLTVADERDEAVSRVRYDWVDQDTMLVSSTVVKQVWGGSYNAFSLKKESILDGDQRLFAELDAQPKTTGDGKTQ